MGLWLGNLFSFTRQPLVRGSISPLADSVAFGVRRGLRDLFIGLRYLFISLRLPFIRAFKPGHRRLQLRLGSRLLS